MDSKKNGILMKTTREICIGAAVSGIGFLAYLGAAAMKWQMLSGIISIIFFLIALLSMVSSASLRKRSKEAVSYNLLWGTGALTVLLGACVAVNVKFWLGI